MAVECGVKLFRAAEINHSQLMVFNQKIAWVRVGMEDPERVYLVLVEIP